MSDEDSMTGRGAMLNRLPGIEVLSRRISRAEDFQAENRALTILAHELANNPRNLLHKLAELACELCRADSAGVSTFESDGTCRRHVCAGLMAQYLDGTKSHFHNSCGIMAVHDAPVLLQNPTSLFPLSIDIQPPVVEALLVPFFDEEQPAGTIWGTVHSGGRAFDTEDLRLMTSLSNFASAAHRLRHSMDEGTNVRNVLERHMEQRTQALSLANSTLQYQISERERIDATLRKTQKQLEAEVAALNRLHELSTSLLTIPDLPSALTEILQAATELHQADMGYIRLYDPERKVLSIEVHQGFDEEFIDRFKTVDGSDDSPCARALRTRRRVMVEDIHAEEQSAIDLHAAELGQYRAIQTTPLYSREGKPLGVLSIHFRFPHAAAEQRSGILDLFARQAADLIESLRITEQLRDADRRKDEFIATLSHELRNPLAAIDSSATLLEYAHLDSAKREWALQVVRRQCRTMKILLDDLLDVSRFTLGRVTLQKQNIALTALIDSAIETTQSLMDEASHTLSVTKPPPSLMVHGDPIRLTQVFSNLLSNAAKYTDPGGKITLDVQSTPIGVTVSVEDNGIGIEPTCLEEIFGMFSQAKGKRHALAGGLGIGLALVRAIAELHGGRVYATSQGIGQGSAFHVHLPVAQPEVGRGVPQTARTSPSDPEPPAKKGCRILVADDNEAAAMAVSMLLQRDGHEILIVNDGASAVQEAERFQPHIALLDIGMPHLSGYEVARQIRAAPWGSAIRLIAATGWGQEKDKKLAEEAGFDAHLTKPINFKDLLALIADQ
ncbi:ATP-binding protein [Nitrosospira sp. Is2]|uniref:hybrid sensor histidine kinase/response regulator n=1 Tax=Nitrosospira sp. Is2 TaxID=3080532 RepID=UPI002953556A|nr:ATP-binding protein [Nitrosospira sp. Is2]WON73774.1 ATP-binding protein [Nitrosospira sp. Is2]